MRYNVGNDLSIQGVRYLILGSILYRDNAQGDEWEEYRLRNHDDRSESWLSIDMGNQEFEMSFMVGTSKAPDGFKLVDSGTQVVRGRAGSVDVDMGETAQYETWEDASGEHTYSVERWSDEVEYSRGMYVALDDIKDLGPSPDAKKAKSSSSGGFGFIIGVLVAAAIGLSALFVGGGGNNTDVAKLLRGSGEYTLVEEASDGSEDVVVYATTKSVDAASKDIINKLEGEVQSVKEDEEGTTVALLTNNEYILVYEDAGKDDLDDGDDVQVTNEEQAKTPNTGEAEAQDENDEESAAKDTVTSNDASAQSSLAASSETGRTLVQVTSRRHAYTTDKRPYHSRYRSYRWYRTFYRAVAFAADTKSYSNDESSYSNYNGETSVDSTSTSAYETYARSIRQQSADAKKTSGGGTSSGK